MRGGAIPLLAWGALLLALYVTNWIWEGAGIQIAVSATAVAVILSGGILLIAFGRREALRRGPPPPSARPEALPSASVAAGGAGIAVGMILFGLVWTEFLVLAGGGLLLACLGRLALELRAQRRSRDREVLR